MIKARLKYVNSYNEVYYFVAFGDPWPGNPKHLLIAETTSNREEALVFDSAPDALACLELCNAPAGWSVEAEDKPTPKPPNELQSKTAYP